MQSSMPAVWVKICSSWLGLTLYLWTLLAPILLPNREFSWATFLSLHEDVCESGVCYFSSSCRGYQRKSDYGMIVVRVQQMYSNSFHYDCGCISWNLFTGAVLSLYPVPLKETVMVRYCLTVCLLYWSSHEYEPACHCCYEPLYLKRIHSLLKAHFNFGADYFTLIKHFLLKSFQHGWEHVIPNFSDGHWGCQKGLFTSVP